MKTLTILRGIPASGKSHFSASLPSSEKVVNKDSIRQMLGYNEFDKSIESMIERIQTDMITDLLKRGYSVVVDNLNLQQSIITKLNRIAQEVGDVQVNEVYFPIDVEEAVRRNAERNRLVNPVPESVIRDLHKRFKNIKISDPIYYSPKQQVKLEQDFALPHVVICDLDGTLCLFDRNEKNAYDRDFENDKLNDTVSLILSNLIAMKRSGVEKIIFTSGRNNKFRDVTLRWIMSKQLCDVYEFELYMREEDDVRGDEIVKREMYENHIKDKYYVDFVLDDRNKIVNMWRSLGLTCLQVAEGDF